jgi:hypothetical protein
MYGTRPGFSVINMSTTQPARSREWSSNAESAGYSDDTGDGWVLFAGITLSVLGIMNVIYGIAAISQSTFFVGGAKFVFSDLKTFGWILLVLGIVQVATALGVWFKVKGVRWVGIAFASLNAIAVMLAMPAYPLWSICLFALDVLVIYALAAHGARES